MSDAIDITGTIERAYKIPISAENKERLLKKHGETPGLGYMLGGTLTSDVRNRGFVHQDWFHTSYVTEELPDNIFRTRNSVYKVISWAK